MRFEFLLACLLLFLGHASISDASAAASENACALPHGLQEEISKKYPGTRVTSLADLEMNDKSFFQRDHGSGCPGAAKVDFYGDGRQTLAVVLFARTGANETCRLYMAHQRGDVWEMTLLDETESHAPVVWSQPAGEYQDVY
jgi:hypothetical protein